MLNISQCCSSGGDESGLEMPQSYVRSYFKQLSFDNWELQLPEDPASMESHRWPIGFVTTGFVRGRLVSLRPFHLFPCFMILCLFFFFPASKMTKASCFKNSLQQEAYGRGFMRSCFIRPS